MNWKKKSMIYTADGKKTEEEADLSAQQVLSNHMIYLVSCILHDTVPDKKIVKALDLNALYKLSAAHSMTAIVCMALEAADAFSSAEPIIIKKWTDAKNKAIRKNILLDAEREQIFHQMDEKGIWYLPLKGIILKDFYPKYGSRQMADNDILFDASHQIDVRNLMAERGYKIVSYGRGNHDVYEKLPIYNYEMHTSLIGKGQRNTWQDYYKNVKTRLISDGDGSCGYHFTDEDFYIYFMTHAYKHFETAGTGLRSLLDNYVYVWKKGSSLNWSYIEAELGKLEIAEFEQQSRTLAMKLFSAPVSFEKIALTEKEQEILSVFMGSGTYGTLENQIKNSMKKIQTDRNKINAEIKVRYCLKRLFPGMDWYKKNIPFCNRHKWAIPFYAVFRIIRSVFFRYKEIYAELRILRRVKGNDK